MSLKRDALKEAGFDVDGIYARDPDLYFQIIEGMELYASKTIKLSKGRFIMPKPDQLIELAILFNDDTIDKGKIADMVAYAQFLLDRLYENGAVDKPTCKELKNFTR